MDHHRYKTNEKHKFRVIEVVERNLIIETLKMTNFNFIRVTLVIVTICSIATFYGVFKILVRHNHIIRVGASTDMNMVRIIKELEGEDAQCQDRLKILELENKIVKEQIDTLFEFHESDKVKAKVIYTD